MLAARGVLNDMCDGRRHVEADRCKVEVSERAPLAGDEVIVATYFHQLLEDQLAGL